MLVQDSGITPNPKTFTLIREISVCEVCEGVSLSAPGRECGCTPEALLTGEATDGNLPNSLTLVCCACAWELPNCSLPMSSAFSWRWYFSWWLGPFGGEFFSFPGSLLVHRRYTCYLTSVFLLVIFYYRGSQPRT